MISLLLLISAVMRLHDEMKVAATSQTITALLLHLHHESLTYCDTCIQNTHICTHTFSVLSDDAENLLLSVSIRKKQAHCLCVTLEISIMTNSAPEAREHLPTPVSVVTLKLTMNTNH